MDVVRSNHLGAHGEDTNDWTMILCFKDVNQFFKLQVNVQKPTPVPDNRWFTWLSGMTQIGETVKNELYFPHAHLDPVENIARYGEKQLIPKVEECRCIRIKIKNYAQIATKIFDPSVLEKILTGKDIDFTALQPVLFCQLQANAIRAESEAAAAKLVDAQRPAELVTGRIMDLPGFQKRFAVRLHTPEWDNWTVEDQSRAILVAGKGHNNIFDEQPGPVPNQPIGTPNQWQGVIFMRDNNIHCSLENILQGDQGKTFEALKDKGTLLSNFKVEFAEDADESMVTRLNTARRQLEQIMTIETGKACGLPKSDADEPMNLKLNIRISAIFSPFAGMADNAPISHNEAGLSKVFASPAAQLANSSHQAAIRNVLDGKNAKALIEGPPATGKTTINAKLIWILRLICNLEDRSIILTAHTNDAVKVACARTISVGQKVFNRKEPWKEVCIVVPQGVRNYWRMTNKNLPTDVQKATLEAHLYNQAQHNTDKYAAYLQGHQQLEKTGRLALSGTSLANFKTQRGELLNQVKSNVKIWFTTMANLHSRHMVFGSVRPLDTHVLLIDEASQATDIYVAMAAITTNPRNIVFAGDAKQLAPFTETQVAKTAWGKSVFERLQGLVPTQTLQIQYRTVRNIYAGTNMHYDNQVYTDDSTIDRPFGRMLQGVVKGIEFMDRKTNKVHQLSNVIHIFNLNDSKCETIANTSSSCNKVEAEVLINFLQVLRFAGIDPANVMILTAYQGQYDTIRAALPETIRAAGVRKIDASQGDEAEIVLFSMVKTADTGLGFLKDLRRHNVGTSRAREGMFLFMDLNAIGQGKDARAWQDWCKGLQKANEGKNLVLHTSSDVAWRYQGKSFQWSQVKDQPLRGLPPPAANRARGFSTTSQPQTSPSNTTSPQSAQMPMRPRNDSNASQGIRSPGSGIRSPSGGQMLVGSPPDPRSPLSGGRSAEGQQMRSIQPPPRSGASSAEGGQMQSLSMAASTITQGLTDARRQELQNNINNAQNLLAEMEQVVQDYFQTHPDKVKDAKFFREHAYNEYLAGNILRVVDKRCGAMFPPRVANAIHFTGLQQARLAQAREELQGSNPT